MTAQAGTYARIYPPHSIKRYVGQPGNEANGTLVPWPVLDSHGRTVTAHLPDEYVVIGEWLYPDGRRFLDFGVTTAYIEATTSHRWDDDAKRLRLHCPACGLWDGKHARGCEA